MQENSNEYKHQLRIVTKDKARNNSMMEFEQNLIEPAQPMDKPRQSAAANPLTKQLDESPALKVVTKNAILGNRSVSV